MYDVTLERCKRTDARYQDIRNRHYVPNHGVFGQQLHYLIILDGNVVGIISGASAVYAVKARDEFFGLNKENKKVALPSIINNNVFRLEKNIPNLATQVLALWRRTIAQDWEDRYGVKVHGFETFVVEEPYRKGSLYKADNWTFLGETVGSTKTHNGMGTKHERIKTQKKLIYAIKIPKTTLSTEYTPTWNKSNSKRNDKKIGYT